MYKLFESNLIKNIGKRLKKKPKYTHKETEILRQAKEDTLDFDKLTYDEIMKLNEMLDEEIITRANNIKKTRRANQRLTLKIKVQKKIIAILEKIIKIRNH